jgi:hypothetical protein
MHSLECCCWCSSSTALLLTCCAPFAVAAPTVLQQILAQRPLAIFLAAVECAFFCTLPSAIERKQQVTGVLSPSSCLQVSSLARADHASWILTLNHTLSCSRDLSTDKEDLNAPVKRVQRERQADCYVTQLHRTLVVKVRLISRRMPRTDAVKSTSIGSKPALHIERVMDVFSLCYAFAFSKTTLLLEAPCRQEASLQQHNHSHAEQFMPVR